MKPCPNTKFCPINNFTFTCRNIHTETFLLRTTYPRTLVLNVSGRLSASSVPARFPEPEGRPIRPHFTDDCTRLCPTPNLDDLPDAAATPPEWVAGWQVGRWSSNRN